MAITDLTGTTWYVPSGWTAEAGYGLYSIDTSFMMGSSEYSGSSIGVGYIFSPMDSPEASSGFFSFGSSSYAPLTEFSSNASFSFTVSGGDDTDNPDLIQWLTDNNAVQLKVTDLTNTTWTVNAGWEAEAGYGIFSIDNSFNVANGSNFYIGYDYDIMSGTATPTENRIANEVYGSVSNGSEWYLTITSGTDIENPKLIAWLSKWGELQVEEEGEAPPDDLTGYTITVPANWTATAGYGKFALDGLYDGNTLYNINIGYNPFAEQNDEGTANSIFINDGFGVILSPSNSFSFSVSGGTSASNSSLIQWLVDNDATFTKEDEEETVTIPAGTYRFKEVLTPLPFDTLKLGYSGNTVDEFLLEYGFDVSPTTVTWTVDGNTATFIVHRFSIANTFGDVYVDGSPTEFYRYIVIDFEFEGERGSTGFDVSLYTGLQFTIPEDTEVNTITGTWFTENTEPYSEEPTTTPHGEIYYKGELVATLVEGETIVLHTKDFKFLGDIVIKNVGEVEEETPTLISFTIDGTSYQAESGMDWANWVGSDYNTGGYYTGSDSTGKVYSSSGNAVLNSSYKAVTFDIEIISGHAYTTSHSGGA